MLNAQGTATNKIVFSCTAHPPQPGGWLGIVISKTAGTGNTSILERVEISHANYGITVRSSGHPCC